MKNKEIYWNTAKDMLLIEDLTKGTVTRFNELPRGYILKFDQKIFHDHPSQYAELCHDFGTTGREYSRVFQFSACNFSTKDGHPDIDDDGNFIFERVSCPVRLTCKQSICKCEAVGELSAREKQVITLFVKGFQEEEIGERLFISRATVHNHITHIYQKLSLTGQNNPDRLLVAFAYKNKIL